MDLAITMSASLYYKYIIYRVDSSFFFSCVYVCGMHACRYVYMFTCVWAHVYECGAYVHEGTWGGLRLMFGILIERSASLVFEQELSLKATAHWYG